MVIMIINNNVSTNKGTECTHSKCFWLEAPDVNLEMHLYKPVVKEDYC